MTNILTFSFTTIPDIASGRRLYDLDGLSDKEVANIMFHLRRQETAGSDLLKPHLQKIICMSAVLRTDEEVKVWSLGSDTDDEKAKLQEFYSCIEKHTPDLISWNGRQQELPILNYRTLLHGVSAPTYWGGAEGEGLWHLALAENLACEQSDAIAPLNEVAIMLGFTNETKTESAHAWDSYQQNNLSAISEECDENALKIYLIYLRHELMRGTLTSEHYDTECELVRESLLKSEQSHMQSFLHGWS